MIKEIIQKDKEQILNSLKECASERGGLSYISKNTGIEYSSLFAYVYKDRSPKIENLVILKEYFDRIKKEDTFFIKNND